MDQKNDFKGEFDPTMYLKVCYKQPGLLGLTDYTFKKCHEFFSTIGHSDEEKPIKVLDYGCGPVLSNVISAAMLNSEIILAEYTDKSREAIQFWMHGHPSAWNWSPYFKYAVEVLEGKDESEALKREESLRKAIKAVVPCDITKEPPIAAGFEGPYDVVISFLCYENVCVTTAEYKAAIKRTVPLIKVGGHLLLYCTIRNTGEGLGYYHIGPTKFVVLRLSAEFVLSALKESGLTLVEHSLLPDKDRVQLQNYEGADAENAAFFIAMRCK